MAQYTLVNIKGRNSIVAAPDLDGTAGSGSGHEKSSEGMQTLTAPSVEGGYEGRFVRRGKKVTKSCTSGKLARYSHSTLSKRTQANVRGNLNNVLVSPDLME